MQENKVVITDASCFILLDKIDAFFVLKELFSSIITTPEIAAEYGFLEIRPYLNKIQETNFRISATLINNILVAAKEN